MLSWLSLLLYWFPELMRLTWLLFSPSVFPPHHQKTWMSLAIISLIWKNRSLRDILDPLSNQEPGNTPPALLHCLAAWRSQLISTDIPDTSKNLLSSRQAKIHAFSACARTKPRPLGYSTETKKKLDKSLRKEASLVPLLRSLCHTHPQTCQPLLKKHSRALLPPTFDLIYLLTLSH